MEKYIKFALIAIVVPGLIGSAIVAALPFLQSAHAIGGCPTGGEKSGHFCFNPHDFEFAGAPPIPSCKSPNNFKNSGACRGSP